MAYRIIGDNDAILSGRDQVGTYIDSIQLEPELKERERPTIDGEDTGLIGVGTRHGAENTIPGNSGGSGRMIVA